MLISSVSSVQSGASAVGALGRLAPVREVDRVARRAPGAELPEEQKQAALVQVSDEGRKAALKALSGAETRGTEAGRDTQEARPGITPQASELPPAGGEAQDGSSDAAANPTELDEEAEAKVDELAKRDREVRTHEQAHKSAGGQHAGAIHYEMERGPDGQSYAVGGHVNIDVSPVADDPHATLAKMQQVMRAALAPAEPSSADRAVAAKASSQAAEARQELSAQTAEALESTDTQDPDADVASASGSQTEQSPGAHGPGSQGAATGASPAPSKPSDRDLSESVARALAMAS